MVSTIGLMGPAYTQVVVMIMLLDLKLVASSSNS